LIVQLLKPTRWPGKYWSSQKAISYTFYQKSLNTLSKQMTPKIKLYSLLLFSVFLIHCHNSIAQSGEDTTLILYYATGQFILDSGQVNEIRTFIPLISKTAEVIGYADTVGSKASNQRLGLLRSERVFEMFRSKTITSCCPVSKGEDFLQDPDLAMNRKVVIRAIKIRPDEPGSFPAVNLRVIDSFDLENLNFIPDKPILTPESLIWIPGLVGRLSRYKDVQIEIIGHVNYQSKRDSSFLVELFKLSEKRAELIYEILRENGFPTENLRFYGVGNARPLIRDPKNDEERKRNMRVQIVIRKTSPHASGGFHPPIP
jgi:outer membrane protein OmpA-like peptidoglycan-associated protein